MIFFLLTFLYFIFFLLHCKIIEKIRLMRLMLNELRYKEGKGVGK